MVWRRSRAKFGNRKVEFDGIKFDSQVEAQRYLLLRRAMQDGEIADLRVHVSFELQPKFKRDGKTERAITYIADFSYIDLATGERVIEDVKGGRATRTAQFEIKRKLMLYKYPDIDFRVIEM